MLSGFSALEVASRDLCWVPMGGDTWGINSKVTLGRRFVLVIVLGHGGELSRRVRLTDMHKALV